MPSSDKITFNFTHFDLEGYSSVFSSRCWGDYVVVRGSYIIKRCGTRNPFIITRYGSVSVTFYSDSMAPLLVQDFWHFTKRKQRIHIIRWPRQLIRPLVTTRQSTPAIHIAQHVSKPFTSMCSIRFLGDFERLDRSFKI